MTCGALLARLSDKRVLLLEKHFKIGGQTHEFRRKAYAWDVGLHYVGQMGEDDPPRRFMDFLTGKRVKWSRMPEDFDIFHYPDLTFAVPGHEAAYRSRLQDRFPRERKAIEQYFRDVHAAGRWMGMEMMGKAMPTWAASLFGLFGRDDRALALQTTKRYLDARFADPFLRAVVASQWPDYGLSPDESAFGIHAIVSGSYFGGGYYPVGGAQSLAPAIVAGIEDAGGAALVNREVTEILVENGRAVGVRARHPARHEDVVEYRAPVVVSNVGARTTYLNLLPDAVSLSFRAELENFPFGHSAVTCYLGLKEDPATLGVHGENHWVYTGLDHDATRRAAVDVMIGKPACVFVSFPSAKDPAAQTYTAELITVVDGEGFRTWHDTYWKHRPPEYEVVKELAKKGLLALSETVLLGLTDLVDYAEVSTPNTIEHFTAWPMGAFYGIPAVPERYRTPWTRIHTSVPGLYLTGCDVASVGILGATMGGAFTAAKLLGPLGIPKVASHFGPAA